MLVYRIVHNQYAEDISGKGAKIHGGRWNSAGRAVVYCSTSLSLALLEVLAHAPINLLKNDFKSVAIELANLSCTYSFTTNGR
jgi:RES domain-containing protein